MQSTVIKEELDISDNSDNEENVKLDYKLNDVKVNKLCIKQEKLGIEFFADFPYSIDSVKCETQLNNKINDADSDNENVDVTDTSDADIFSNTFRNRALEIINKKVPSNDLYDIEKMMSAKVMLDRIPLKTISKPLSNNDEVNKKIEEDKNIQTASQDVVKNKYMYNRYCVNCKTKVKDIFINIKPFCKKCQGALLYQCSQCNKNYEKYGQMYNHTRYSCQAIDKKLYTCEKCTNEYYNENTFKMHVKYCSKESWQHCYFCNYKTKKASHLHRHLKLHVTSNQLKDDPNDYEIYLRIRGITNKVRRFCLKCDMEIKNFKGSNCRRCKKKIFLKCLKCNNLYENIDNMNDHIKLHEEKSSSRKIPCLICDFTTNNNSLYKKHLVKEHHDIDFSSLKNCKKCGKQLRNKYVLHAHLRLCKNPTIFVCDECSYETKLRLNFINHRLLHRLTNNQNVEVLYKLHCPKCNDSVSSESKIKKVEKCCKCRTKMLCQCLKCSALFDGYNTMLGHSKTDCTKEIPTDIHRGRKICAVFICDSCPYKTSNKSYFAFHKIMHLSYNNYFTYHSKNIDTLASELLKMIQCYCSKCNKTCNSIESIRMKVDCHQCKQKLIFRCVKCKKQSNDLKVIKHHVRRKCLLKRYYQCTLCNLQSINASVLRVHIDNVHLNVKPRYECPNCKKKYRYIVSLQKHQRKCQKTVDKKKSQNHTIDKQKNKNTVNFEEPRESAPQTFIKGYCQSCDKSTRFLNTKSKCKKCNNLLVFKCTKCNIELPNITKIRRHIKNHVKNYNCTNCGKKFANLKNLKMHQRVCSIK